MSNMFMFDEITFPLIPDNKFKNLVECKKPFICHCGKEVHKHELYYSFKPAPTRNKFTKKRTYYSWLKSCYDCEPMSLSILIDIELAEKGE